MSVPDLDEQRRIRRGRRRYLFLVLGTAVAFGALLGACAGLGWYDLTWQREPPRWADLLGLVLEAVGFVVEIVAVVYAIRTGRYRANRDSRLRSRSWSARRDVMRRVRRGGEVAEEELPLLRHTAQQLARHRWLIGMLAGLAIVYAGQALLHWSPLSLALFIVFAPLCAVGGALTLRDARRAEEFLRAHPAAGEDSRGRTTSAM